MNNTALLPVSSNLISASAGTGKTYQLSSRFIALLALGYPPESLVALTFTRNAAGEFKERILNDLAKGAASNEGAAELRDRIMHTCRGDSDGKMVPLCPLLKNADAFDCAFFRSLLKKVIASLSKLQLSTIDSFFNRLVCSHSLELGYSTIRQMSDAELAKIQCRALKSLLQCEDESGVEALKILLQDAGELDKREKGSLNVLLRNTKQFYGMFKDAAPAAWGNIPSFQHLSKMADTLERCSGDERESALRALVEQMGKDLEEQIAKVGNELSANVRSGIRDITAKFLAGQNQPNGREFKTFLYQDAECRNRLIPLRKKVLELIEAAEHAQPEISKEVLNAFQSEIKKMVEDLYHISLDAAENLRGDLKAIQDLIDKCQKPRTGRLNYRRGLENFVDVGAANEVDKLREMAISARDCVIMLPAMMKTRNLRALMEKFDGIYDEDVRGAGMLVFDDITRAVPRLLDLTNENNIAYRLDSMTAHWMLDEFQDTSPMQWDALQPMLIPIRDEVRESGGEARRSLFVVGDEKQSIYGFRGASPELFAHLQDSDDWRDVMRKSEQNDSQRSADTIMGAVDEGVSVAALPAAQTGFVNTLFSKLSESMHAVLPEYNFDRFCHHNISPRLAKMKGHVYIESFSRASLAAEDGAGGGNAPSEGGKVGILEQMCMRIRELLGPKGINFAHAQHQITAAILVRTNKDVLNVYKWFCKNSDIPVMPLGEVKVSQASFLGELLLHLFKWLQHPGNEYSRSLLHASPLKVLEGDESSSHKEWQDLRTCLEEQGIVAVLQQVAEGMDNIDNDAIFQEWLNAARAFDAAGGNLDAWIVYIENLEVKMVPPKSYVHIMTYHKSKGAEYDAVFLPMNAFQSMLDGKCTYYKTGTIDEQGRATMTGVLLAPKTKDEDCPDSPYNRMYDQWRAELLSEALNVLYVATTRAKYANYILLREDARDITYSSMIRSCCLPKVWGDPKWYENNEFKKKPLAKSDGPKSLAEQTAARRRKVSPSLMAQEQAAAPKAKVEPAGGTCKPEHRVFSLASSQYGTAVHACFEQLEWLDGSGAAELFAGDDSEAAEAVRTALKQPDIASIFRRPNERTETFNEQAIDYIDTLDEKEVWVSGIIDRLVVEYAEDGKAAIRAHIYDYKTNTMQKDDVVAHDASLREEYAKQMDAYRKAVAKALQLGVDKVEATLVAVPRRNAAKAHLVAVPMGKND